MVKQVGPLFITGTIDGIIFYKLNGQYYMRSKGDYRSGKQMRKDPRLKRTMQNADRFGVASKIVKYIYYRHLPREVRKHGLFGQLTGRVNSWLRQGKSKEEAEALLIAHYQTLVPKGLSAPITPVAPTPATPPQQTVATIMTTGQASATQSSSVKPLIKKPVQTTTHPVKQARYLSRWKVKRNGKLQMPRRITQNTPLYLKESTGAVAPVQSTC
jgi:hypothetical protein